MIEGPAIEHCCISRDVFCDNGVAAREHVCAAWRRGRSAAGLWTGSQAAVCRQAGRARLTSHGTCRS